MNELKRIVQDMESVFSESSYPRDFLEAWDQMECLANHTGRETFLSMGSPNFTIFNFAISFFLSISDVKRIHIDCHGDLSRAREV